MYSLSRRDVDSELKILMILNNNINIQEDKYLY